MSTVAEIVAGVRELGDAALNEWAEQLDGVAPARAEPGMVAVHSVVPAAEIWRLLPALEEAGASSILLVPVERMLA